MSENSESPNLILDFINGVNLPDSVTSLADCREYYKGKIDDLEKKLINELSFVITYEFEQNIITNKEEKFEAEQKKLDDNIQVSLNYLLERCNQLFTEETVQLAENEKNQINNFVLSFEKICNELESNIKDFEYAKNLPKDNALTYLVAKSKLYLSYDKISTYIRTTENFMKENQILKNTAFIGAFFKEAISKFQAAESILESAKALLASSPSSSVDLENSLADSSSNYAATTDEQTEEVNLTGADANVEVA